MTKARCEGLPFDKLRDRVTKAHIPKSKGANGAVAVGLPHCDCDAIAIALKGLNEIAQGNALGSVPKKAKP